jgi:hypothetical protein
MDSGGREAMLYDLLHMDISGYDLRSFPRTQALLDQIVNSMSTFELYWYDQLCNGILGQLGEDWNEPITVYSFYASYIDYAQKIGQKHRVSKSQMGKELRKLCPNIQRVKKRHNHLDREFFYIFPPLEECRKVFEERVKIKVDWDTPASDEDDE